MKKSAEAIVLGQSDEFIQTVLNDQLSSDSDDDDMPEDVKVLTSIHAESNFLRKSIILSLVDHQKYTKDDMQTFNCSRCIVDKARKLQPECVGLVITEKAKQSRINRLPIAKVEHFLDFLFSSSLMQDVAYGVNKIKFNGGDEQKVANSILTMKYSHTIAYYRQFCSDTSFEPSVRAHYEEF